MASVITNSTSLKKFRNELLDTVEDLREQLRATENAIDEVSQEWKDPQFKKYYDEFSKDKEQIEPLCKKIEEYEDDVLRGLYDIVYEYENL
ncbi:MAG: hypothetical protein J6R50_04880 [Alistipes sp.]|nr:hypothetical protein [Alistipes sp.]MBO7282680.1 hypothetical protein [Alistipes sp.]